MTCARFDLDVTLARFTNERRCCRAVGRDGRSPRYAPAGAAARRSAAVRRRAVTARLRAPASRRTSGTTYSTRNDMNSAMRTRRSIQFLRGGTGIVAAGAEWMTPCEALERQPDALRHTVDANGLGRVIRTRRQEPARAGEHGEMINLYPRSSTSATRRRRTAPVGQRPPVSASSSAAFENVAEFTFKSDQAGVEQFPSRHDDDVEPRRESCCDETPPEPVVSPDSSPPRRPASGWRLCPVCRVQAVGRTEQRECTGREP